MAAPPGNRALATPVRQSIIRSPGPRRQRLDLRLRLLPRAMQLELRRATMTISPLSPKTAVPGIARRHHRRQYDLSPDQLLLWHMLDGVWQFYNAPHANLDGARPNRRCTPSCGSRNCAVAWSTPPGNRSNTPPNHCAGN
jgi:hypothetical protein